MKCSNAEKCRTSLCYDW